MSYNNLENWDFSIPKKKFSVALLASIAAHLLLAWLISFNAHLIPLTEKKPPHIMDVTLLDEPQSKQKSKSNDAKVIANRNNTGNQSGAKDKSNRAARAPAINQQQSKQKKTLPIAPKQPRTPPVPSPQNKKSARILNRDDENSPALLPPKQKFHDEKKPTAPPVPNIPLANLLPTTSALTQLSREYDRERRMQQMLSKEADIGINTREDKYAPYAQGLVRALEEQWRPADANLNELQQDERKILMRISIEHNGTLGGIKIVRPSPSTELNASAVAAVHAAAPFKPLPNTWGLERANFYLIFEVVEDGFVFRTL